jgi:hypothetical protein
MNTAGRPVTSRRTIVSVAILATLLFCLTVVYRFATLGGPLGGFENDEFVTLSQAQQIILGEPPLHGFAEMVAPLTVALSAAALHVVGPNLFAEAVLTITLLAVSTTVLFVLAWRISGSVWVALVIALLQLAMAPRFYNYPKLLAYGVAIPALWAYVITPTRRRLVLVALAGVFAFLLRLDHGAYVAAAAMAAIVAAHWPNVRRTATELGIAGALGLALVAPYLAYVQQRVGIVEYFREFLDTAQRAAGRTNFKPQGFSIDRSQPLIVRVRRPAPLPRIHVRWHAGLAEDIRQGRERALGLVEGEPISGDVWNYALRDSSRSRLMEVVQDPLVADTQGIDRSRFILTDPDVIREPSRLERLRAGIGDIAILPGVLTESNAVAFLYYLLVSVPLAALALALVRWWRGEADPHVAPGVIAVIALLAILISRGFLRGNLPSRLADVSEVAGVLAAWVIAHALARRSRAGRAAAVATAVLLLMLTAWSVGEIEGVTTQVAQTRIGDGIDGITRRVHAVHQQLTAVPPIAAWSQETPGVERLAWYVNQCTRPSDRVLIMSYLPEVFFLSARGFAAGHVWIQPGFDTADERQRTMIAQIESPRVPIAITEPEPAYSQDYLESFPLLGSYLDGAYSEFGVVDFGRGFRYRVLVRRGLTPVRSYGPLGLPCYS